MSGKQIKVFLVDGTPGGLRTAEITNWTGHVLAGERSDLAALLNREEVTRTGVYVLLGEHPETGRDRCYVGEADDVGARLRDHERKKDFWDRAVVVTNKDANLTKAHARYVEQRLIRLAKDAKRAHVENVQHASTGSSDTALPPLPEADASDMDYFVKQLQIVLPVLGVNAFRATPAQQRPTPTPPAEATMSPVFHLRVPRRGIDARAQSIDGEFTLLPESRITASWRGKARADSVQQGYATQAARFQGFVDDGSIRIEGANGVVTRPIPFMAPSAAGAIATGRSTNGRTEWKTDDGTTYGEWETRGIAPDLAETRSAILGRMQADGAQDGLYAAADGQPPPRR